MSEALLSSDAFERLPVHEFTEKAYLDYSMYVILDRALPHVADGLKPVQRRIIYAMSELGLKATSKFKKSARTVGDVLGKYHPHGDSACYEAMVLMAQPFSYRYPFVDGQGNWGSPDDPKSFAAMRYTEARLSHYAKLLLEELGQGTVSWQPNFDGTLDEPINLPAQVPNILLNGGSGIAVGMATDIPPHNLTEVLNACICLLEKPKTTSEELNTIIPGPDFPTDADIITPKEDILRLYETGNGSIKMRALYSQEDNDIVITALPHQVSGNKILEQIAAQMQAKKLPMVVDLRDESDHENPTRLVIVAKSNRVDVQSLMLHLFATTDLEKNIRVNLNMIGLDGRPQVKGLLTILKEWLQFRQATVKRRLEFRHEKVSSRLHILDGLLIAYLNLDEVIRIIREEDDPKAELIKCYQLSEIQANAILDMKLRHLGKLEEIKIVSEQNELNQEKIELEKIINSETRLKSLVKKELKNIIKEQGDARRSTIIKRPEAQALSIEDRIPAEPITIVLSTKGWVRQAKGHDIKGEDLNYKSGDAFLMQAEGKSNQPAIFLDSTGRVYSVLARTLASARSLGEPLTGKLQPEPGATFKTVLAGDPKQLLVLASDAGYGFICSQEDLSVRNKRGKACVNLPKGSELLAPVRIQDINTQYLALVTNEGRLLCFPLSELPQLARGKGNKLISIPSANVAERKEFVQAMAVINKKDGLTVYAGRRHIKIKLSDLEHYIGERGRRGHKLPRGFQKADRIE